MRKKLTELYVTRTRVPAGSRIEAWDALLPGFGIRIGPRKRTWIVAQRRPGKQHPTRIKIGTLPPMSLTAARDKARPLLAGEAPAAPIKFKELVDEFLAHARTQKGRELRQNTVDQYRRNLNRYAAPLHKRPFAGITRRDVAELLRDVASESGAPTASVTRSMLARLWGHAVAAGHVELNVVSGTPSYAVSKRSRVLSDGELRALWAATKDQSDYHLIVRLLLWTGARRGEVGGMRWSELADGEWHVPGERTKNHRALVLPLPKQVLVELARRPRVLGRDHLFGQTSPRGFNGWAEAKDRLDAGVGFNRPWDVHDLRRTVETRMAGLGIPKDHVNRVLNHAAGPITEAYDQWSYMPEKAAALRHWADELERITSKPSG
jgi:integrase